MGETTPAFGSGGYVGTKLIGHEQPIGKMALTLGNNILKALGMFQWIGDHAFRTNVSGTPVLDPLSGILMDLGLAWLLAGCGSQPSPLSDATPPVARTIENEGSDTLVNLALAWAEAYMSLHPDVRISVTGGGSGRLLCL